MRNVVGTVVRSLPERRRRRLDRGHDVRVERRAPEAVADVLWRLPPGVQLRHHPVLEQKTNRNGGIDSAHVFHFPPLDWSLEGGYRTRRGDVSWA